MKGGSLEYFDSTNPGRETFSFTTENRRHEAFEFKYNQHAFKHLDAWIPMGTEFWKLYMNFSSQNVEGTVLNIPRRFIELATEGVNQMIEEFMLHDDSFNDVFDRRQGSVIQNNMKIAYTRRKTYVYIRSIFPIKYNPDGTYVPVYQLRDAGTGTKHVAGYSWVPHHYNPDHIEYETIYIDPTDRVGPALDHRTPNLISVQHTFRQLLTRNNLGMKGKKHKTKSKTKRHVVKKH